MQSSPPQRIALVGFDDGRRGEGNFRVSYHGGVWQNLRPHHVFQNWTKYFRLPWICFLEIALFCMYFFFASFHLVPSVGISPSSSSRRFQRLPFLAIAGIIGRIWKFPVFSTIVNILHPPCFTGLLPSLRTMWIPSKSSRFHLFSIMSECLFFRASSFYPTFIFVSRFFLPEKNTQDKYPSSIKYHHTIH